MTNLSLRNGSINKKKLLKYLGVLIVIFITVLVVRSIFTTSTSNNKTEESSALKNATVTKELGKEVGISIKDNGGKEVDKITMRLENIELRDEIIVKGQKASSVAGRSFLVVNIKLSNPLEQGVEINTKDYLRLGTGAEPSEWLAPDIHNDPVLVQAISTKPTRVAFPVNASERRFVLQIGEISGDKEKVELDLTQ